MPSWTLNELRSRMTAALGNRPDLSASDMSFWVNEAYEEVWSQLPFDEQEAIAVSSTTVNEDKLTLPSDFQELLSLSNTSNSNTLLDPINPDQVLRYSEYSGTPTHYALYATWLELRPIPDSAYSLELRYRKQRSELTVGTSVPSISTRFRRAIFLKACELVANNVTFDFERASDFRNQYVQYMSSMPSDRALRAREMHATGMSLGRERGETTRSSRLSFDQRID